MKHADFIRIEKIGEFDKIEIIVEADVKIEIDKSGKELHTVDMEIYAEYNHEIINLFPIILFLCKTLYKSLEKEALEKAE